ncbi:MAG: beta-ketoacyl-[acyl-carrier-protein] synthase family protein [Bacteroidetes bacterium]|nr:beta-ketoacyl-[acyl-carrier-protein] synthase family protein [Bacteroidota bacterium]
MKSPIYIAGIGIISAIGDNAAETLAHLTASETGVSGMEILPSAYAGTLPVAEVKYTNAQLAAKSGLEPWQTRTAQLSMIAAREAKENSKIDFSKWRCGFISANTVGGMDRTEDFMKDFLADASSGDLHDVINHDSGDATEIVAEKLGCTDYITTISTACSSSANAMMYGARLIQNDIVDVIVAGGTDALSRFTLNGFKSLMILDEQLCQPFDENRRGLNLGEGAGYVVLVSQRVLDSEQVKPLAILSGYANANDAYHQTASSPEGNGNYAAMTGALAMARLTPAQIDYINLHGTGTPNNDVSEGTAIRRVFGDTPPVMSSTKAYTGHTLGASAGIEGVISVLALQHGVVFPNLRHQTQMKELAFGPQTSLLKRPLAHVLSNSFGFGGNCSSVIFSKS